MFCLLPELAEKVKAAFRSGKFDFVKMADMDSVPRRRLLEEVLDAETAKQVNLLIEQKIVLKNWERALVNLAREITGISKESKEAMIANLRETLAKKKDRIFNPQEGEKFLNELTSDIYSRKYKTEVSLEEAQTITELSADLAEAKAKENWTQFGAAKVALDNYVGNLKMEANKVSLVNPLKEPGVIDKGMAVIENARIAANFIAENARSIVASMDNSFWGRQGIKTLLNPRYTRQWIDNFVKSWSDIGRTLKGDQSVLDGVKAEIYSRENYRNGRYEMGHKLDIGTGEEAFPTTLPERIPALGRLFKASQTAYEAGAMRLRADIADKIYRMAEKSGVDMTNKVEVGSINELVNSMTGRGNLGGAEGAGKILNKAFFSAKFFKSNFDFLTAHLLDPKMSAFAKKEAITNLLYVAASTATILGIAKALNPDSVETDPTSSNFGKIRIGDTRFDVTGGMSSLIVLFERIRRQYRKSSSTGKIQKFDGKFGSPTGMDVLWDFTENKFSPFFTFIKEAYVNRRNFLGEPVTIPQALSKLITPIGIQNYLETKKNEKAANIWLTIIADFLGISSSTY